MVANPDFSGWATKANLKCSDGRTITSDAFKDQDKTRVPLVWNHGHSDPDNILGYAILEHRAQGVYCEGYFNNSEKAQNAKIAVEHGDINAMSIFANKLVEKTKTVLHGVIREVSLVIAGANPGALIENISIAHSDGAYEEDLEAAVIYTGLDLIHGESDEEKEEEPVKGGDKAVEPSEPQPLESQSATAEPPETEDPADDVAHAATKTPTKTAAKASTADATNSGPKTPADSSDDSETVQDVFDTMTPKQQNVVYYLLAQALGEGKSDAAKHSDEEDVETFTKEEVNEVFHSMTEKQQNTSYYMVAQALEHKEQEDSTDAAAAADDPEVAHAADETADEVAAHSDSEKGNTMTHNVFDKDSASGEGRAPSGTSLTHSQQAEIFKTARRHGGTSSLKETLEDYISDHGDALAHGIDSIELLFPDAKNVTNTPNWLSRRTEWVAKVLDGTRHVPFSRIKSQDANLTMDEARAKGYIKGNLKREEFFGLTQRVTTPQTIYKKQKLDRDDILDITDFDVVVWLKGEMRLMLDEEVARAILLGDGRDVADIDKINESHIRPIATDADYYNTKVYANIDDANSTMEEVMDVLTLNRRHYRGSGNPTFFTSETFLAKCLMVKDGVGRRVYNTPADVAANLRVSEIVTCEILDQPDTNVIGVLVNLADYTVGADKGGEVNLFDDFDIDYNQEKYLIEVRLSGALVKAKSAITVLKVASNQVLVDPVAPTYNATNHTVTVATTTGVVYKNKATNATLTNSSPVTLAVGDELVVVASPASGYYLASSANDEFNYTYEKGRVAASLY